MQHVNKLNYMYDLIYLPKMINQTWEYLKLIQTDGSKSYNCENA